MSMTLRARDAVVARSGTYHGIATHDPKMIDATIEFAQREESAKMHSSFKCSTASS